MVHFVNYTNTKLVLSLETGRFCFVGSWADWNWEAQPGKIFFNGVDSVDYVQLALTCLSARLLATIWQGKNNCTLLRFLVKEQLAYHAFDVRFVTRWSAVSTGLLLHFGRQRTVWARSSYNGNRLLQRTNFLELTRSVGTCRYRRTDKRNSDILVLI